MPLQYTICFCLCGELVLMLYRKRPPNQFHWNGLGGKLQKDETPQACVMREVLEEANIDLHIAITAFDRQKSSDSTYVQTLPQSCKIAEVVSHYFSHKERKT